MADQCLDDRSTDEIMLPSPLTPNASRHGRGRHGGSFTKNKTRGRAYSAIDERQWLISKALSKVLKLTANGDDGPEPSDNWANCEKVREEKCNDFQLAHDEISVLGIEFFEIQALCNLSKSKFALRPKPGISNPDQNASDYMIGNNPSSIVSQVNEPTSTNIIALSLPGLSLPKLIVYETSYANYPLVLASGGIRRAGGQAYLSFKTVPLIDATELPPVSADVSIYIDLPLAMEKDKNIKWFRSETGAVITEGDAEGKIDKSLWKNVVGRRADIGILYEDGQVKKEVPIGLRGKGTKPKKSGKGMVAAISEIRSHENNIELCSID
ncbi:putative trna 2 -phosphotransferase 1 protein [Golovinomyces cichoracearum]|uniref:Putative trna 2-phosphotransferase 1 protein n=1 Tax=Golovinomyces cichoracearum TaxID=62708 RepID=A0A420J0F4_9PEZI|nr:putative trna 2 -phosphotransferase 1 protein [Golovinomyces cichoracearum]